MPTEEKNPTKVEIQKSLLNRAIENDKEALKVMFSQFLGRGESVIDCDFLGTRGIWGIGKRSFICLTDKRICTLEVGFTGEIRFFDGYLEHINGGVIYQPSIFGLYAWMFVFSILAISFTFGIGLLLFPFAVQFYYRFVKCGAVWVVREGIIVYAFSNRNRLKVVNRYNRMLMAHKDLRSRGLHELAEKQRNKPLIATVSRPAQTDEKVPTPPTNYNNTENSGRSLAFCLIAWTSFGIFAGLLRCGIGEVLWRIPMWLENDEIHEPFYQTARGLTFPAFDIVDAKYEQAQLIAIQRLKATSDDYEDIAMAEEILNVYEDTGDIYEAMELLYDYGGSNTFYDAMTEAETDLVPTSTLYSTLIFHCVWPTALIGLTIGCIQFAATRKKQ